MTKKQEQPGEQVTISPPNFQTAVFRLIGTAPYVQNAFSKKAREAMKATQEAGSTAKKGKKREPKDFKACHEEAKHESMDGWPGMPASAFRNAMISACRIVGFHMTKAKLSLFAEADGFDAESGVPLIRFAKGKPEYCEHYVRLTTGVCDIRARALWKPGWEVELRVRFDGDQFTLKDVTNLLMRVGMQVGIGEGRPDSPKSCGMGWGLFALKGK